VQVYHTGHAHNCLTSVQAHFGGRWDGAQLCGFMEGCAALPKLGAVATQLWQQELLKVNPWLAVARG